jgi:hypothetical protein
LGSSEARLANAELNAKLPLPCLLFLFHTDQSYTPINPITPKVDISALKKETVESRALKASRSGFDD